MNYLNLLREIAGSGTEVGDAPGLPPHELRFVLEYDAPAEPKAERARLADLIGLAPIVVEPLGEGELARFLILRIPGVERTLPQRDMFGIAYALADAARLVTVEPELGTGRFADPKPLDDEDPAVESADLLRGLCWVDGTAPPDRLWALKKINAIAAWQRSRGAGIHIAQPDTGVAAHDEIEAGMAQAEDGFDFVLGRPDPTDPLPAGTANPGHGTGTASVAASREAGTMAGAAPDARIVPIRCIEDVKVFNAAPLVRAIDHAVKRECDIVTMSLGGLPSRALRVAVRKAVAKGLIVVAAAGNCVRIVVYPAAYDEVIAVAGTNEKDRPWKGSSRGPAVDISAPAEFVYRASRSRPEDPTNLVSAGQGTSFAVALVAGAAALWLSRHGRDEVLARARAANVSVQQLFKAALRQTARRPADWDEESFGVGIVDADALTRLPLDRIDTAAAESTEKSDGASIARLLDEETEPAPRDPAFDYVRYGAELTAIALAETARGSSLASLSTESKSQATRPSPQLSAAVLASSDHRLHRFAESATGASIERPLALPPRMVPVHRLRHALKRKSTRLEGTSIQSIEQARPYLRQGGVREQLEAAERQMQAMALPGGAVREIVGAAEEALDGIATYTQVRTMRAIVGLEALVSLSGRPVVPVKDGTIDFNDPRTGEWSDELLLITQDSSLPGWIRSVGRIDAGGVHVGTGFVVGDDLVMTNRHVAQVFAAPVPSRNQVREWKLIDDAVTFDPSEYPSSQTRGSAFRVTEVVATGPGHIDDTGIDFTDLDVALLRVEPTNRDGGALPPALRLSKDPGSTSNGRSLVVIGYPARPSSLPVDASGGINMEVVTRLGELFGHNYGRKYVAPGTVLTEVGSAKDPLSWSFDHDASTLGGNSGSCVIELLGPTAVAGLHFGGQWLEANFAHCFGALSRRNTFLDRFPINWNEQ